MLRGDLQISPPPEEPASCPGAFFSIWGSHYDFITLDCFAKVLSVITHIMSKKTKSWRPFGPHYILTLVESPAVPDKGVGWRRRKGGEVAL